MISLAHIMVLGIVTVCGDPIEVITLDTSNKTVEIMPIIDDVSEAMTKKMMKTYDKNILEITRMVPGVCI